MYLKCSNREEYENEWQNERNSEAEKHLCEVRCLVRFQGENETWGEKSRVRIVQIGKQGRNKVRG